jgi:AAA+ superfamily predicted ATPase
VLPNYSKHIPSFLEFLQKTIALRLDKFFQKVEGDDSFSYPDVGLEEGRTSISDVLHSNRITIDEFIILLLALTPHIRPNFLDALIQQYLPNGGDFPEFGGIRGNNHRGLLPTGETAQFIVAGNELKKRLEVQEALITGELAKQNIISLEPVKEGEPIMSGRLVLSSDWLSKFLFDKDVAPKFGPDFPAKLITTKLNWEDLVINSKTAQQIKDIKVWLDHHRTLLNDWGMSRKIKPGYRALFYGPPGTGKTMTASLLGKEFNKDVYRIDLSQIVSKYIGETEKNLEKIFVKAEHKDWILFFDEADALFGKRSNVQSAHDKYANQEVSYLLQRVEDFSGLIILASNYKTNIDSAFVRRFNAIIHFPMPGHQERYELWNNSKPLLAAFENETDMWNIAAKYELSGSAIMNIIHYASLQALNKKSNILSRESLLEGIKREYEKEERVFS